MMVTGKLKFKFETKQVSDKFKVREFIIITDYDGDYPQSILMQTTQDKCDILDNYKVGDIIDVMFNLRGREWTNPEGQVKYFNSIDAWKITANGETTTTKKVEEAVTEATGDLPF